MLPAFLQARKTDKHSPCSAARAVCTTVARTFKPERHHASCISAGAQNGLSQLLPRCLRSMHHPRRTF